MVTYIYIYIYIYIHIYVCVAGTLVAAVLIPVSVPRGPWWQCPGPATCSPLARAMVCKCSCTRTDCLSSKHDPARGRHCTTQVKAAGLVCKSCQLNVPMVKRGRWSLWFRRSSQAMVTLPGSWPSERTPPLTPPSKRVRLRSKMPAWASLAQDGVIHHLWIDGSGEQEPPGLSDECLECLQSWVPRLQCLWLYADLPLPSWPGLRKCDLQCILPRGRAQWLLLNNVPVQVVKDMLSLRILARHGGIFTDLDIFSLGREIPLRDGYVFTQEPETGLQGTRKRKVSLLSLQFLGAPVNTCLAGVGKHMERLWHAYAKKVLNKKCEPKDWRKKHTLWMRNTRMFSDFVRANDSLSQAVRPPIYHLPLGASCRNLPPFDAGDDGARVDYAQGEEPSRASMVRHSLTLGIWARQWPPELKQVVLEWVRCTRAQVVLGGSAPALGGAPMLGGGAQALGGGAPAQVLDPNRKALVRGVRHLCLRVCAGLLPEETRHRTLANGLRVLHSKWMQKHFLSTGELPRQELVNAVVLFALTQYKEQRNLLADIPIVSMGSTLRTPVGLLLDQPTNRSGCMPGGSAPARAAARLDHACEQVLVFNGTSRRDVLLLVDKLVQACWKACRVSAGVAECVPAGVAELEQRTREVAEPPISSKQPRKRSPLVRSLMHWGRVRCSALGLGSVCAEMNEESYVVVHPPLSRSEVQDACEAK